MTINFCDSCGCVLPPRGVNSCPSFEFCDKCRKFQPIFFDSYGLPQFSADVVSDDVRPSEVEHFLGGVCRDFVASVSKSRAKIRRILQIQNPFGVLSSPSEVSEASEKDEFRPSDCSSYFCRVRVVAPSDVHHVDECEGVFPPLVGGRVYYTFSGSLHGFAVLSDGGSVCRMSDFDSEVSRLKKEFPRCLYRCEPCSFDKLFQDAFFRVPC